MLEISSFLRSGATWRRLGSGKTGISVLGVGLALLLAVLVGIGFAPRGAEAQGGNLAAFSGAPLTQAELGQGTKVLVFFTTWSPHCKDVFSRIGALEQRWGSRSEIIAVNFQEDRDAVSAFLGNRPPRTRTVMDVDGALAKKHGITTLPALLVLRNGEVLFSGKLPADPDSVLSRLLG